MRIILHVQPRRPAVDAAQQQMLHRVEADRTQRERVFDGLRDSSSAKVSSSRSTCTYSRPPCFSRASSNLRSVTKRKVVQRIVDHSLVFIIARMPCFHLACAGDGHLVDVATHQQLEMSMPRGHRVVVAAIAHQRQRTDSRRDLLAGFIRCRGQRQQRRTITLEAFADGLGIATQTPLPPLAARGFQMRVECIPTGEARHRHHEVAPRVTHQPLHLALIVALGRSPNLASNR